MCELNLSELECECVNVTTINVRRSTYMSE